MRLFATRHGQVIPSEYFGDELYQSTDRPLTELGHIQAETLGRKLAEIGFDGVIYSSPFRRTIQTAEHIADYTGCKIVPVYWLHERITNEEHAHDFRGMTREQLLERFRHIDPDFTIKYPWFAGKSETTEEIDERIKDGMDGVVNIGKNCLLVCHGASFAGVRRYLGLECPDKARTWNCSLTEYDVNTQGASIVRYADVSFMTDDLVTDNRKTKAEVLCD